MTQRISGPVMLNTTSESYGASFIAFNPANEDQTTLSLLDPEALLEGKMFASDDEKGIILGYKLAENLGASLGNRVVYTMTDKNGEIVSGLARLSGTIKTGAPRLDASLSLLPLSSIREIIGYAPDGDGFFWLAGQGGIGIMTSPAAARTAAALVMGDDLPADVSAHGIIAADLAPERPGIGRE